MNRLYLVNRSIHFRLLGLLLINRLPQTNESTPVSPKLSLNSTDKGPGVTHELNDTERSSFRSYNDNRSRGSQ
ncbi:hypothetical protein V6N13_060104 [Hibiscus sabdariffa]